MSNATQARVGSGKAPGRPNALGVIVVLYKSADVIEACLRSLLHQRPAIGRIVLVDNCCPADSVRVVEHLAEEEDIAIREISACTPTRPPERCIELIRADRNNGFAAGVNLGLRALQCDTDVDFFWVLNPDCELTDGCAEYVLTNAKRADRHDGFALMGTRLCYHSKDRVIQSDGGIVCRWTGRCRNINQGRLADGMASGESGRIDFVSGASMIASRAFVEQAGPMPESYFLYYEEVAWAYRRGALPLIMLRDAVVLHHGGTAIGSGAVDRLPSAFSNFFNFRNRMRFLRAHHPSALPLGYGFSLLKIGQTLLKGGLTSATGAFSGLHGLRPPKSVQQGLDASALKAAFGEACAVRKSVNSTNPQQSRESFRAAEMADP